MQPVDADRPKASDDDWIRFAAPMSRYEDPTGLAISSILLGVVGTYVAVQAILAHHQVLLDVLIALGSLGMTSVGVVVYRRLRAAGCRIEPSGLRVRNVFLEAVVPWDRIEGFSLGQGFWASTILHRTGGPTLSVTGIRAHPGNPEATEIMDRLNAELLRRRRAIDWNWHLPERREEPRLTRSSQLRPGFAVALAVVGGVCLVPFAIGIAFEAGRDGVAGAVAVCLGLFLAPAVAIVRLRGRKAPLAFTTLSLTFLVLFAMIADAIALIPRGAGTIFLTMLVAIAALAVAVRVKPPQVPGTSRLPTGGR